MLHLTTNTLVLTEYGKRSVLFNGDIIYNELPIEIRKIENFKLFMKK